MLVKSQNFSYTKTMSKGFFSNKIFGKSEKSKLEKVLQKTEFKADVDELLSIIKENEFSVIFDIDIKNLDLKVLRSLLEAYYNFGKNQFENSFTSSFFLIEFVFREKYGKTSSDATKISSKELIKWAKNREILQEIDFYYMMAFKIRRNQIVHHLGKCSKEEAKIIIEIAERIVDI